MKEKIKLIQDDICKVKVDAIICPGNLELEVENEITQKIFEAGGDEIYKECNNISGLEQGMAVVTTAGDLPAKYIIHTILGDIKEPIPEEQLMLAIRNALEKAKELQLKSVSMPLIGESEDIPIKRAAELILTEIKKHFDTQTTLEMITLVVDQDVLYEAFEEAIRQL